jgi:origin recognition complex subunit 2
MKKGENIIKGRSSILGRTNKRSKMIENDVQEKDDVMQYPSIQEYTQNVRTYRQDELRAVEEEYVPSFEQWRFISSTNRSLLLFGAGSKRSLLNRFADEELDKDGDVMKLDGFNNEVTILGVLQLLIDNWLDGKEPPSADVYHVHNVHKNDNDHPQQQQLPFYPLRGDVHTVQKAAAIAKSISKVVSRTLRPLYLVVHNIDGTALRNYTAQESLAALVSQSRSEDDDAGSSGGSNAIRLIASIDHINAPALLWDTLTRHRFQWIWKEVQTQRPYVEEVVQAQSSTVERTRNRKSRSNPMTSEGDIGMNGTDPYSVQQRDTIFSVLKSLASRHTQALQQLAWLHLESKNDWISYVDLLHQCRLKCVVTQDTQLRQYLGELMDHHIVIRKNGAKEKSSTSSASSSYRIPYPEDVLEMIMDYQV